MGTIAKIDGVTWTSIAKVNGIAVASIAKVDGMDKPTGGGGGTPPTFYYETHALTPSVANAGTNYNVVLAAALTDGYVLLAIHHAWGDGLDPVVTFDGTTMTSIADLVDSSNANYQARMFGLAVGNKTSGTKVLNINTDGGGGDTIAVGVCVFNGVHQTTPIGTVVTAQLSGSTTSTTPSVTVTTAAGDLVVGALYTENEGTKTDGADQTRRVTQETSGDPDIFMSTQLGSDGGDMTWTLGTADHWLAAAVPLKPAS